MSSVVLSNYFEQIRWPSARVYSGSEVGLRVYSRSEVGLRVYSGSEVGLRQSTRQTLKHGCGH